LDVFSLSFLSIFESSPSPDWLTHQIYAKTFSGPDSSTLHVHLQIRGRTTFGEILFEMGIEGKLKDVFFFCIFLLNKFNGQLKIDINLNIYYTVLSKESQQIWDFPDVTLVAEE